MGAQRIFTLNAILLTAGLLVLGYLISDVLLLVFAAILIAVGLDGWAGAAARHSPLSRGWALVAVASSIALVIVGSLTLTATGLIQQFQDLGEQVTDFWERVQDWLSNRSEMDVIDDIAPDNGQISDAAGDMLGHAMTFGISALGAISSLAIIIVLSGFLAANPELYRGGLIRLVRPDQRAVADDTLSSIAYALRWWFLGQLVSMALLGVTVGVGLLLLGIDLWFALAVLTALLTFVPFLGPLIATVPIVAVGFAEGTQTGLIVLAGYLVIQNIEGSFITPLIQKKAVNLAPALLITTQVLLSLAFGVVGLILAAPLTIVAMVSVQKLYVENVLGEDCTQ
ncbi:MAG: AI-2E family transporter [Roseinatronobacter sp.]